MRLWDYEIMRLRGYEDYEVEKWSLEFMHSNIKLLSLHCIS